MFAFSYIGIEISGLFLFLPLIFRFPLLCHGALAPKFICFCISNNHLLFCGDQKEALNPNYSKIPLQSSESQCGIDIGVSANPTMVWYWNSEPPSTNLFGSPSLHLANLSYLVTICLAIFIFCISLSIMYAIIFRVNCFSILIYISRRIMRVRVLCECMLDACSELYMIEII